jgi:hypothetical protein
VRTAFIASSVTAVALLAASCGAGDGAVDSDAERFCGEAIAQQTAIVSPPLATEAELAATLDFYTLMGQLAPIGIAQEWNDLVVNLETASTVVPGDPESEQRVALRAFATERSAFDVATWLRTNCGLNITITTIAPQEQVPARTTTVPGADAGSPTTTTE